MFWCSGYGAAVRNSTVLINTRSLAQMFAVSCSLGTLLWLGCLSNTYKLETIFIAQLFLPPEVSKDDGCGKRTCLKWSIVFEVLCWGFWDWRTWKLPVVVGWLLGQGGAGSTHGCVHVCSHTRLHVLVHTLWQHLANVCVQLSAGHQWEMSILQAGSFKFWWLEKLCVWSVPWKYPELPSSSLCFLLINSGCSVLFISSWSMTWSSQYPHFFFLFFFCFNPYSGFPMTIFSNLI